MFPIDFDPAVEARKFAVSRAEELPNTETDRRARRIEFVGVLCRSRCAEPADYKRCDKIADFHFEMFFASVASVFKSGVRERGSRPNRFPKANAGSDFTRV